MNLNVKYMTRNDCYTSGKKINPQGIIVHSTATPGVMAADWFSRWNKSYKAGEIDRQVCVHAFVDDKEVWQYLPWDHRGWHAGGKANDTHIGFEICEPKDLNDKEYFNRAWENAVELAVFLCKEFSISPDNILGHYEAYKKGIATNHADPGHWFPKHNKSMDDFRAECRKRLEANTMKNPIMGKTQATAYQMDTFLRKVNPDAPDVAQIYLEEGEIEGVRGDIAFAQAVKETNYFRFTGIARPEWYNPAGLGVTGQKDSSGNYVGNKFPDWRTGIRAQIQHLKAYASKEPLKQPCVDQRFHLVTRGVAPNWEDLNGRWAVPGTAYGQDIIKIWQEILKVPNNWKFSSIDALAKDGLITDPERLKNKIDEPMATWEIVTLINNIYQKLKKGV